MILGIGTDIIEIDRIEKAIEKNPNFLNKVFTEKEIELFKSKNMRYEVIAGNFAGKEALSKALGTGIRGFALKDIEILRDHLGKPVVIINDNIKEIIGTEHKISISISHNKNDAVSFVILEAI
ncbi:holo-ACP synthase [Clostridium isatidis]|uniref:Holo-[acyl-carrier-protein] synthase n=1 Tax=Clostridium isatidis TaxID=182773 RepID=A0A343JFG2_9CLOT|nr:holo-ACP synthase [Clostridium isatidis]ASW44270.1 holo-ACP synthase [Clostridium isatidis]NLZ34939.1 holo-ACP synthase [Clostridiales bacterium]